MSLFWILQELCNKGEFTKGNKGLVEWEITTESCFVLFSHITKNMALCCCCVGIKPESTKTRLVYI